MSNLDRQTVLDALNKDWGRYVSAFRALLPADQTDFLSRQGYKRLADLLAHLTAWWIAGMKSIVIYRIDPEYQAPSIDVDTFNAAAIAAVKDKSEEEVVRSFEAARLQFIHLVNQLTDVDFQNEKVVSQLNMELIGHYHEHQVI